MKKIMIVNTSSEYFGISEKPTGLWLGELIHFYDYFNHNEYEIDLFNVDGKNTPIDPVSLNFFMLDSLSKKYFKDESFMWLLKYSEAISYAYPGDYDVIYFYVCLVVLFVFICNSYL